MKKLLSLVLAAILFAACTHDNIEELSSMRDDQPDTLFVGFDVDDTRIQLNENLKSVWTEGDLVSVFYKSDCNDCWAFVGETGDREGELNRVSYGEGSRSSDNVVVVYPYDKNYIISLAANTVELTLPTTQFYAEDSFGVGSSPMIATSEFNKFKLKNVCGWFKFSLTGSGERVTAITLRGNRGEQVAGRILVSADDASSVLAATRPDVGDEEIGGTLIGDGDVATAVKLLCAEGVELGETATAFYVAVPPQSFAEGITLKVECADGTYMIQSSSSEVVVNRNVIKQMESFAYVAGGGEFYPDGDPEANAMPNDEIWYTTSDGSTMSYTDKSDYGFKLVSNTYTDGKGVLKFDSDVTMLMSGSLSGSNVTSLTLPRSLKRVNGTTVFNSLSKLVSLHGAHATSDGLCYVVDGELQAFIGRDVTEYTIPEGVTAIGDSAFYNRSDLERVYFPEGVTSLGNSAFQYCSKLSQIDIPEGVTYLGDSIFYDCDALLQVNIPGSVTSVGYCAFFSCYKLTEVVISNGVVKIGNSAFSDCSSLQELHLPDSVKEIGDYAFHVCRSLQEVHLPDSVKEIGDSAFASCSSLQEVHLPDSIEEIGKEVFSQCTKISKFSGKFASEDGLALIMGSRFLQYAVASTVNSYTVPEGVEQIDDYAFYQSQNLTTLRLPESIYRIGNNAIAKCSNLSSVYFESIYYPTMTTSTFGDTNTQNANLTLYVYEEAIDAFKTKFSGYSFGSRFVANGPAPEDVATTIIYYATSDNSLINVKDCIVINHEFIDDKQGNRLEVLGIMREVPYSLFTGNSKLWSVTLPSSIRKIAGSAFYGCSILSYVSLAEGLEAIHDSAFYKCKNLSYITIPQSCTDLGSYAFTGCTSLKSIVVPDNVKDIGTEAFKDCTALKTVALGRGIKNIYSSAFKNCTAITEINMPETLEYISSEAFSNSMTSSASFTLPATLESVGNKAFDKCYAQVSINCEIGADMFASVGFSKVTIAEGITSIGDRAFASATTSTFILPNSLRRIGDKAFYQCKNASFNKPTGLEYIGESAFQNTRLAEVSITREDAYIGPSAFIGCSSLRSVTLPQDLAYIPGGLFSGCSSLKSIDIPDSITVIGGSAFSGCSSLTEINIPEGVTHVKSEAFSGCSSLTEIRFPESVIEIGYAACLNCTALDTVYCCRLLPPGLGEQAFRTYDGEWYDYINCRIYVRPEAYQLYLIAGGWKSYADDIVALDF
ncbi:MAG: leucine-rich repeat protein [Alistipes sp.]|nr:leucine-rich repeat protein [Alistipes sp.]